MEALNLTEEREYLHWSSIQQVSVREVLVFINQTGLTKHDLADVLEKSTRTIDNLLAKDGKLSVRETETYLKFKELAEFGIKIFGSEGFIRWMDKENTFLSGKRPKDFLRTDSGIELMKEQLLKIAYGYVA